jgi:hypothetical protein
MWSNLAATREILAPYLAEGRAVIMRDFSVNAAKSFEDGSLDWVYLDGNHHYEAVKEDMEAWWPKIRTGGVLSGHDWIKDDLYFAGMFGVMNAVVEFALAHERQIVTTHGESTWRKTERECVTEPPSWYFRK